ncbi:glycosyltransferase family 2 protein [Cellvibrio mixtus]|uniref:glycosyltransferase family 2 protein n=1 Tax=Cellvibrio mixtus TaxID=39650 RepID=UPI0006941E7A|nr:glycosyltransferase [Cellvibrio mixtus]
MEGPLVSVIMPTYNRKDLIVLAIDSVIAQDYSNWELYVVDDGSSDNTGDLLKDRYGHDARIHYVYQKNAGQSSARNHGIELSQGEYVAFLDSDNLWKSNRLSVGVNILRSHPDVGLCFADSISIDLQGNELGRNNMRRHSGFVFPKMIIDNFVSMNTVLVKRSILPSGRPFNQLNRLDEDYELWLDLSVNNKYFYIPEFLSLYRIEGDRVSNDFMRRLDANEKTVKNIISKYQLDERDPEIKHGLAKHYLRRAGVLAGQSQLLGCIKELKKSITYDFLPMAVFKILAKALFKKVGLIK